MNDSADDAVGSTEHTGCGSDVAVGQGRAHGRRGPALAVADILEGDDLETVGLTELTQRRDVTGVLVAEAGVDAHDDDLGLEPVDEGALDELLRRLLGELLGELQDEQTVEARRLEQVVTHRTRRDDLGGAVGVQHGERVRVERHGHSGQPALATDLDEARQHRLVAVVDAVEVAERDDTRRQLVGRLGGIGEAVHGGHSTNSPERRRRGSALWPSTRRAWRRGSRRERRRPRPRDARARRRGASVRSRWCGPRRR